MVLNHNMPALNALRNNKINDTKVSQNVAKLASGYRINSAADDPAGLAISEKMRAQIRGMNTAVTNAENASNLVQTADGGLQELNNILHRMKEVAVQAANGTYHDDVDREALDMEMQSLKGEFDRVAESTNYNGIYLLNGSLAKMDLLDTIGDTIGNLVNYFQSLGFPVSAGYSIEVLSYSSALDGELVDLEISSTGGSPTYTLKVGDKSYTAEYVEAFDLFTGNYISAEGNPLPGYNPVGNANEYPNTVTEGSYVFFNESGQVLAQLITRDPGGFGQVSGSGKSVELEGIKLSPYAGYRPVDTPLLPAEMDLTQLIASDHPFTGTYFYMEGSNKLLFQIGANGYEDQQVYLYLQKMFAADLGTYEETEYNATGTLEDVNVLTRDAANDAIKVIDAANVQVTMFRSVLSALQNRLDHTLNNLGVTIENLQDAESTIRDLDMAREMTDMATNEIKQQSTTAMLAQANEIPKGFLSLLM